MPYRRPTRRFRRSTRRRPGVRLAVKRYVRSAIKRSVETKANTNSQTGALVTSSGSITGLLIPAQGDSSAQRDGDVVAPSGGIIHLGMENGTLSGGSQFLRMMVVQMRPGEPSAGLADFPDWISPVTLEQRTKYRVLYDRTFALNPLDSAGNAGKYAHTVIRFSTKQKARWAPASTTGVSPDDGGAIVFYKTSDAGASGPRITWKSEVFYKDC